MTTLRVLLTRASLEAGGECSWASIDRDGRLERSGRDTPAHLPRAASIEGLLAPDAVRVIALRLPPLPPGRRIEAARMELEDRSIDGLQGAEVAVSEQQPDGTFRVAVCDARTANRVRAFAGPGRRWQILSPLSERIPLQPATWTWVAPGAEHSGFVVTDDGSAFEIEQADGHAPPSLVLALAEVNRAGRPPSRIVVVGAQAARMGCLQSTDSLGIPVDDGGDWSWWSATPPPVSSIRFSPTLPAEASARPAEPVFRAAGIAVAAAAILYGLAVVADWVYGTWRLNELADAQRAIARSAAPELLASLTPSTAVARRLRQSRHQAGLPADDDLLPLLARAAAPLAALPPGSLRGSSFADGQVLVDLAPVTADALTRVQRDLTAVGMVAVAAPTASGSRIRITLE